MSHLRSLLKPQSIQTLPGDATVAEAAEMMTGKHIGSVIVVENEKIAGIFTERDLLNKVVASHRSPKETLLKDVMTTGVTTVSPETTVDECFQIMRDVGCRHLPVIDDDKIFAIVSIRHVLDWTIEELQYERDQLAGYIHN